ncbi:SPFH domain-containing protein [Parachitinimonas caeni]|uniref:SPFH domain-containing protein n=1 Tax=Parachitinimonas caeni TaxID=3031301 RepID=A0ABT7DYZ0_9NEIS|nr:SPFH domain-containing protein [Parachitinimonas caeni]MDK2123882.1 SPFH domain-containing protein [Parachitinimonas caeni]
MKVRSKESVRHSVNGYVMVLVGLGMLIGGIALQVWMAARGSATVFSVLSLLLLMVLGVLTLAGLYSLQPNQAAALQLFGSYCGTDRHAGLRWANPFFTKRKISLRARNLALDVIKVNDKRGNPVEIGAAIVWRVSDTAQALFDIDDYERYVHTQSETVLRHLASLYGYDDADDTHLDEPTLRGGGAVIAGVLRKELAAGLAEAGLVVDDAKLTHLAYATEIAGAMLRRQQAEAVLAARRKIVAGAVSMVEMALHSLSEKQLVELDDERKAAMVSNLLVVLCAEKDVTPVVNSGTLYG